MKTDKDIAKKSQAIVEQCRPLLAGQGPDVVGAALLDLVSIWLASHPPAFRDVMLATWLATLPDMIDVNEKIIFGDRGHPGKLDS